MVAYSFNAQQHTPSYGGGGGLPAGPNGENVKYKVMIVGSQPEDTKDQFGNVKGGYLAFELASIEGPTQGQKQVDRLNLHHTNPKVVEIANKQLSAYCHVLGKFQFNDTNELHNIPFIVEIGLQKAPNPNGYTEVKAIYDINGNEPGKAGAGPQANQGAPNGPAPNGPPAGGVQPQGQWGGAPQGQPQGQGGYQVDNNVAPPNGQGGGQPQGNPQGGGWGGPAPDQGQQGGQSQGGGWGGQGGQPQGNPQGQGGWGAPQGSGAPQGGQGGGWGQQGGGQSAAPGWGQR